MSIKQILKNNPSLLFVVMLIIVLIVSSLLFCYAIKFFSHHPVITNGYQVPELWIDPETNCQYFLVTGGITPRLGTNGFPLCGFELPVGSE